MIGVLSVLQQQGLLDKSRSRWPRTRGLRLINSLLSPTGGALPFDLERTFASGFVSVMLSFIDADHSLRALDDRACQVLDDFVNCG